MSCVNTSTLPPSAVVIKDIDQGKKNIPPIALNFFLLHIIRH